MANFRATGEANIYRRRRVNKSGTVTTWLFGQIARDGVIHFLGIQADTPQGLNKLKIAREAFIQKHRPKDL
jgi:hypothetical protein